MIHVAARQVPKHRSDLILGQHHRDAVRLLRAHDLVQPSNILFEDLLVQKQDSAQCLALHNG